MGTKAMIGERYIILDDTKTNENRGDVLLIREDGVFDETTGEMTNITMDEIDHRSQDFSLHSRAEPKEELLPDKDVVKLPKVPSEACNAVHSAKNQELFDEILKQDMPFIAVNDGEIICAGDDLREVKEECDILSKPGQTIVYKRKCALNVQLQKSWE